MGGRGADERRDTALRNQAERSAREAEALRSNLRRRKEQAQGRAAASSEADRTETDLPPAGEAG